MCSSYTTLLILYEHHSTLHAFATTALHLVPMHHPLTFSPMIVSCGCKRSDLHHEMCEDPAQPAACWRPHMLNLDIAGPRFVAPAAAAASRGRGKSSPGAARNPILASDQLSCAIDSVPGGCREACEVATSRNLLLVRRLARLA